MLREALLFLSRQPTLRRWMETSSIASQLTRRFIAGQTLQAVLPIVERLHERGIQTSLDHLGENVSSVEDAIHARVAYEDALQALSSLKVEATISVKLTQIGLDLGTELCLENARRLARLAQQTGTRVEFDMESSEYTDRTLQIVETLHAETGSVRAVLQAYLYRTEADVARLDSLRVPVRLCKGAYNEPAAVAIPQKKEVDKNYRNLVRWLLDEGTDAAIATHDPVMIEAALAHASHHGYSPKAFEFQMLYGVRRDLQERLRADGYRLRLYVPYGNAWYPYFMRRLAERPANLLFIAKNFFRA